MCQLRTARRENKSQLLRLILYLHRAAPQPGSFHWVPSDDDGVPRAKFKSLVSPKLRRLELHKGACVSARLCWCERAPTGVYLIAVHYTANKFQLCVLLWKIVSLFQERIMQKIPDVKNETRSQSMKPRSFFKDGCILTADNAVRASQKCS